MTDRELIALTERSEYAWSIAVWRRECARSQARSDFRRGRVLSDNVMDNLLPGEAIEVECSEGRAWWAGIACLALLGIGVIATLIVAVIAGWLS